LNKLPKRSSPPWPPWNKIEVTGNSLASSRQFVLSRRPRQPDVIESIEVMRAQVRRWQQVGERIGVVPTMGALHEGHLSLVRLAQRNCSKTVGTIFVNPTQFAPHEDFARYPRTFDQDLALLTDVGCDRVFVPSQQEMYPSSFSTSIDPPVVARRWEGEHRPGHFRGVTTVVLKLLNSVPADEAWFGQKDYQQAAVIQHMARDLNVASRIEIGPTIRESDGLAMSSRNRYLSPPDRQRALILFRSLQLAREMYDRGERQAAAIEAELRKVLSAQVDALDYIGIADAETLEPLETLAGSTVVLLAARIGSTRLIDNCLLTKPD
jgi:pantoate--beta-alanine ligase